MLASTGGISGGGFFLSSDRCVAETSDVEEWRGGTTQGTSSQVELFFARSRASAQAPIFPRTRTEPNRSLNDPCPTSRCTHRWGEEEREGEGSISLDPNNNRSWNGLHLDSLVETENNRKNGAIFDYLRKIFIYVMIPFLLEIYFLECINDSNYKIRYIKFYSWNRSNFSTSKKVVVFFLSREETILKIDTIPSVWKSSSEASLIASRVNAARGIPSILSPRETRDEIQINNRGIICTAACILKHRGGGPDKFVSLTSFQGGEIPFHPYGVATARDEVGGSQAVDERIVEITPSKPHSVEGRRALSHVRKEGKRGSRKDSVEREERPWNPSSALTDESRNQRRR